MFAGVADTQTGGGKRPMSENTKTMKTTVYDVNGKERWLSAGQIVPAGWHGADGKAFTREMRVEALVIQGEDIDMDMDDPRNRRKSLQIVPNISAEQAAAEAAAKEDSENGVLTAALGGRQWRSSSAVPADARKILFRSCR